MNFSPLDYSNLPPAPERRHVPEQLEIDTGKRKRITGLIAYLLFFATVAGLLVFVFLQFTPSVMLAVGLVSFMVLYMSIMGWVTSRNLGKRDFRKDFSRGRGRMAASWDTFERFRQKGLDARRAGQWDAAKLYLLEASRTMVALAKDAQGESLKDGREQIARRLLELARDCESAKRENRRQPPSSRRNGSAGDGGDRASESEGSSSADQWIVREKPSLRFDDVAGLDDVKEDIRLKMLYPFQHPELAERFDVRPGGGVLLYGPPGTGKTMLAKATAGEIDATFFRISPADVLSKWVGEAKQNIKKLFDAAAAEPRAIIFIDEIEALVPARRDEGSSVMQRVVPQILQGMEGFEKGRTQPILFMGATNVPWQLDPAVLRPGRFDEKVYIPLPDLPARRKMLDIYLGKRPVADVVDLDALAARLHGYSGADIKYVCDRAATIPFLRSVATGQEGEITPDIIADVLSDTPPSVKGESLRRFQEWASAS